MKPRPRIWAHRGASAEAPENSLAAFERAIAVGADGIELDVQRTADGILVVTHDETTDRLTGQPGSIAQLTLAQLRQLNFAAPWPDQPAVILPTLDEVLDLCRKTSLRINIELKNSEVPYRGMEKQVVEKVRAFGLETQVIYSSFNPVSLWRLRWIAPDAPKGFLYSEVRPRPWLAACLTGATALHPSLANLDVPGLVEKAHSRGLAVHVWTVDEPAQWEKCHQLAVDAIITNKPREALAFFDNR
ncbi:MAG: glycerophosphodiester phosphodiesterase [Clostridia bacterium]|nr:glycerophosphodiester phosphodiesterase [Clostridia bacterium]NCC77353.1 glycerophosphodiester phosphodiesterase [Clostridia bacterium]